MITKILKWGNSLGLRIPKSFAEEVQVSEGSTVDLVLRNGQLIIRVVECNDYHLDDLLSQITPENVHAEIDSGDAVGRENW